MTRFTHFRWLAALTLAIALAPGAASAQEDDTLTVSGLFSMDYLNGELDLSLVAPDLAAVYVNGQEHTWTLTLHGTTHSHSLFSGIYAGDMYYATEIHATSFDLEFFGPDAATLNGFVSDRLAGGDVNVYLENAYWPGGGFAIMHVWVAGGDLGEYFYTGQDTGAFTLFPADADGYPVVGPLPFSIAPDYTELGYFDMFSGTGGAIGSLAGPVTFEGSMGERDEPDPVVLAVADVSVSEGNRGTRNVAVAVSLSSGSSQAITVQYATANGTAVASLDYTATRGTLTFQPGETSRTISIAVKGDRKREANEIFSVQLSNPVGATIGDGSATVTILNDD